MTPWMKEIAGFKPECPQEAADQALILQLGAVDPYRILTRESLLAHITSSGFILNPSRDKTLMAFHNIYQSWAWTGGHADGDDDLKAVALREAREETGITQVELLTPEPASVDIIPVDGHMKRGQWVCTHVHMNITYLLVAPEDQLIRPKADENKDVAWLPVDWLADYVSEPRMLPVYHKLTERARRVAR